MEDAPKNRKMWIVIFIVAVMVDAAIIIWAILNEYYLVIYAYLVVSVLAGKSLINMWNQDERTDMAIDNASRKVISIFFIASLIVGFAMLIYSQFIPSILWVIGTTLIVAAIILFYFHAVMAVYYESRMR